MQWLDEVSSDEKKTIGWAYSRASAQTSYDRSVSKGTTPEDLDSENPLEQLITTAMSTMDTSTSREFTYGNVTTSSELVDQPWFQGFADQLGKAVEQTNQMYG